MEAPSPAAVVAAWHEAVNARDIERLLSLSSPSIELVGPRGVASGHEALRGWLHRAGLTLQPLHTFARGEAVVVAARAAWHSPETGEPIGEADIASCFRVSGGQVAWYARYDALAEALAAGGLGETDEVRAASAPSTSPGC